jgi:hypothetical protein
LSPLPSLQAGRNPFIEVDRVHDSFDSAELHILSNSVAHAGESDGEAIMGGTPTMLE